MSKKSSTKGAAGERAVRVGNGIVIACLVVAVGGLLAFFLWPMPPNGGAKTSINSLLVGTSNVLGSAANIPKPAIPTTGLNTNLTGDPNPDLANSLVSEGTALLNAGRYAEAVTRLRAAVYHNPQDEDMRYNLAIALARVDQLDEAIKQYNEALRLFPDYVEARINLGNIYRKQARDVEAVKQFEEAIRLMPEHAGAHNNLGTVLAHQKKMREAILEFAEAVRLDPKFEEARFNLGNGFLSQKKKAEAIEQFTLLLKQNPGFELASKSLELAKKLPD